ncbi:MAG TPA: hypothetical protein VJ777_01455, partial [Mycobacterium sp.]|nr:hypothetical protein [Mycobacterium sp.]
GSGNPMPKDSRTSIVVVYDSADYLRYSQPQTLVACRRFRWPGHYFATIKCPNNQLLNELLTIFGSGVVWHPVGLG